MNLDELFKLLVPVLGIIAVALIRLRPQKISLEQMMSDELKRTSERMGQIEASNRELREELQDLQRKVNASYYKLHRVKRYAFDLEDHIHTTTGNSYVRPEDVDSIFKDL